MNRAKAPTPTRQSPAISFGDRARIVGSFTIGNSDTSNLNRRVDQGLKNTGWSGFVAGTVQQAIDDGFVRFSLHNPFGTLEHEEMLASQYLHAKAAGLTWLTDGFAEAWKPITKRFEVISYHGSVALDPSFLEEWKAGSVPFSKYVQACFQPAIEAGMTIALDSHLSLPVGSPSIAAHRFLQQFGVKRIYSECGPSTQDWHWFKAPMGIWIANDNSAIVQDKREDWQLFPLPEGTETILQLAQAPGEIVRNDKYHAPEEFVELWEGCEWHNYPTWIRRFIQYHFDKGRTVAINPRDLTRFGLKLKDILPAVTT